MADHIERMKWNGIEYEGSTEDGKIHAIKITSDGGGIQMVINDEDCWPAAHFLMRVSQVGAERSGGLKPPSSEARHNAAPLTAIGIGAAPGRSPGNVFFAVHIGTEQPAIFETTTTVLRSFLSVVTDIIDRSGGPTSGKPS